MKRMILMLTMAAALFGQKLPKWDPAADQLWDPCSVLSWDQREQVKDAMKQGQITTYVIVLKDFSAGCIGKKLADKLAKEKKRSKDPLQYSPAGAVLSMVVKKYHLAENARSGQSLALLVTAIRGDPKKRWVISVSEPTHQKVREPNHGEAYLAFAKKIGEQGDTKPAKGQSLANGLLVGLPLLYAMLQ